MTDSRLPLGVKAKDLVSGFEGTIVARYEYLNGCHRYELAGVDKDQKPEAFVYDGQQLVVTDPVHLTHLAVHDSVRPNPPEVPGVAPTGGDRSNRPVAR